MSEKLTITRALAELKLLEKKINSAVSKNFIGLYQKKSNKILNSTLTIEEFEKESVENLQSLTDLLSRKERIKSAISRKNAETKIKVGKREMTIAEAIGFKIAIFPQLKQVLQKLRNDVIIASNQIERSRLDVEEQTAKMLNVNLGKDRKADDKSWETIAKPFIEQNELNISDKANIREYVETFESDLLDFESNIDFTLSEINAKTEIEI